MFLCIVSVRGLCVRVVMIALCAFLMCGPYGRLAAHEGEGRAMTAVEFARLAQAEIDRHQHQPRIGHNPAPHAGIHRQVGRLDGNQHVCGCDQCIDCQEPKRRLGVDDNETIRVNDARYLLACG